MGKITLITGGIRSGKSSYALTLASGKESKVFIATSLPFDDEMKVRIERHKKERDASFQTIEEPIHLASALKSVRHDMDIIIVDCIAVWLGNIFHFRKQVSMEMPEISNFLNAIKKFSIRTVIITNEVNMGLVDRTTLNRCYQDIIGMVNKQLAYMANDVVLMVSGIPVIIKNSTRF